MTFSREDFRQCRRACIRAVQNCPKLAKVNNVSAGLYTRSECFLQQPSGRPQVAANDCLWIRPIPKLDSRLCIDITIPEYASAIRDPRQHQTKLLTSVQGPKGQ